MCERPSRQLVGLQSLAESRSDLAGRFVSAGEQPELTIGQSDPYHDSAITICAELVEIGRQQPCLDAYSKIYEV